jgi:hypothetical protein
MRISLHCLFLWSVQRVREPMVGEGCCDCLVDSRQGHAGHAAVNTAQRAVSVFEDHACLLALHLQLCF